MTNASKIAAIINLDGLKVISEARDLAGRLYGLGISTACTRCAGTGNHGPVTVKSGRCFKCGGTGATAPKLTRAIVKRVQEEVTPAVMAAYLETLKTKAAERREAKGSEARVKAVAAARAWNLYFYPGHTCIVSDGSLFSWLGYALNDFTKEARDAWVRSTFNTSGASAADVLRLEAELLAAYARCDRAFVVALDGGEIAADCESLKACGRKDDQAKREVRKIAVLRAAVLWDAA